MKVKVIKANPKGSEIIKKEYDGECRTIQPCMMFCSEDYSPGKPVCKVVIT